VSNFAGQMGQATLVLLATQTLHISTRGYGLVLAATALGSVLGGFFISTVGKVSGCGFVFLCAVTREGFPPLQQTCRPQSG
jgi:hypothetical protein